MLSPTSQPVNRNPNSPSRRDAAESNYFRIRDFEYVQPLYDLAFLLEVGAIANKSEIPKYRIFSLWRAGYSLDGYGTTIDQWLDGTIGDEGLDYVPSSRIKEYLYQVRETGTLAELGTFSGERFARCLRLRSVRGLGPNYIALSLSSSETSDEWLNQCSRDYPSHRAQVAALFKGKYIRTWQSAHQMPPIFRFVHALECVLEQSISWYINGIDDPFEPITTKVSLSGEAPWPLIHTGIERVLKRERLFRLDSATTNEEIVVQHQMGWSFVIRREPQSTFSEDLQQLIDNLDPLSSAQPIKVASDLHLHTAWSDGSASINTMATAVVARGMQYCAVTDHSRSCKLQGGLTPLTWLRQANALTLVAPLCPVLHGIEVDILKDGALDLPDSILRTADLVVASVHSSWSSDSRENTSRLVRAIESGCIDVLAHPTSAITGKPGVPDYLRAPAEVDWGNVFETCARYRVALEFNCFPARLDLPLPLLTQAVNAGCAISLGSDAHARSHLLNLRFGEAALRRLKAGVVLNLFLYSELQTWIRQSRAWRGSLTKSAAIHQQSELLFEPEIRMLGPRLFARIQSPLKIPDGSRVMGIDLTAGDKATGIAILDRLEVETVSVTTDDEIMALISKHEPKIVSIDSPLGLPGGGETVDPTAGIVRVAEQELSSIGIPSYPALIDSMEKLTLRGIRLRKAIEAIHRAPRVIESYPGAAQDILCIPRKQKSLNLLREGLRRLGIEGTGLDTRSHDEMDAITSAVVGRYYEANLFEPMGVSNEAQLIVPKISPLSFDHNPIICLAGKTAAGKSVVARYLSVFYGFQWLRTRNVIRELMIEDSTQDEERRLFQRKIDPACVTENDLRDFGSLILDVYKQVPLRMHLMKLVMKCTTPVVVDSIRDIIDVESEVLKPRPVLVWFVDCAESIIRSRLADTKKSGNKRVNSASPVDRTAPEIRLMADRVIPNSGSLEELRWAVEDALFRDLQLRR